MEDLVKKFLHTGVGLVAMTADRVQQTVEDMVGDGKISKEEGKKVLNDFIDSATERFSFVPRSEYEALEERVAKLEASLDSLKKQAATTSKSVKTKKTPAKRRVV